MELDYCRFNPYLVASGYMSLHDCPPPETYFPIRIVRWYELELIHKADKGYVVTRDHRILAEKGVLMIRKPGMVVQGVSAYECSSLIFDGQYDSELIDQYREFKYEDPTTDLLIKLKNKQLGFLEELPDYIKVSDYAHFKNLFEQALSAYLRNNKDVQLVGKQVIHSLITALLVEVNQQESLNLKSHNPNAYDAIFLTKERMDTAYHEPLTLSQLSESVGYSKEAYCRLFKKVYGKSPIDYLIDVRLYHAKNLLMTTRHKIYDIALACGFNNDTYFYTVFKKKEGISPTRYRDTHRWL